MEEMDRYMKAQAPTALRPLLGQTVLAVEDSRFACEAIRLVCLRSGARIRRADSLSAARRHLSVYRPTVVIVDIGLPDGSGAELIEEVARAVPRVPVLLATSGDDSLADAACAAGADAFLAKPVASIAAFQSAVLAHLPPEAQPHGPRAVNDDAVTADTIAYYDDLDHALDALSTGEGSYVGQFLTGVARQVGDGELEGLAHRLCQAPDSAEIAGRMERLLSERMGARLAV
ncbi:MAG: response regulator [Pseudomonadota bacterium]